MKNILKTLAVLVSLTAVNIEAEIRTVVVDRDNIEATISIEEGEVGKCVFLKLHKRSTSNDDYRMDTCAYVRIIKNGTTIDFKGPSKINSLMIASIPIVSGPAIIKLISEDASSSILSMDVTSNESLNSKNNVTVLPKSTESMNLILESSTDLVNWTADTTGTKTPSDKKRFYRLRVVKE
jgi:hypothetical protein